MRQSARRKRASMYLAYQRRGKGPNLAPSCFWASFFLRQVSSLKVFPYCVEGVAQFCFYDILADSIIGQAIFTSIVNLRSYAPSICARESSKLPVTIRHSTKLQVCACKSQSSLICLGKRALGIYTRPVASLPCRHQTVMTFRQ